MVSYVNVHNPFISYRITMLVSWENQTILVVIPVKTGIQPLNYIEFPGLLCYSINVGYPVSSTPFLLYRLPASAGMTVHSYFFILNRNYIGSNQRAVFRG
jgi:hypothetical protein